jgi:hypothetical protein
MLHGQLDDLIVGAQSGLTPFVDQSLAMSLTTAPVPS